MFLIKPKAPVFLSFLKNTSCQLPTINGISHFVTSLLRGKYKCQSEIKNNNKLSKDFFSQIYIIMFIMLILLLRILSSKEDSGINKRIYQKAFFKRHFSCKAPHSIFIAIPISHYYQPPTSSISRPTVQLYVRETQSLFFTSFLPHRLQPSSVSFISQTFVKSIHLTPHPQLPS